MILSWQESHSVYDWSIDAGLSLPYRSSSVCLRDRLKKSLLLATQRAVQALSLLMETSSPLADSGYIVEEQLMPIWSEGGIITSNSLVLILVLRLKIPSSARVKKKIPQLPRLIKSLYFQYTIGLFDPEQSAHKWWEHSLNGLCC